MPRAWPREVVAPLAARVERGEPVSVVAACAGASADNFRKTLYRYYSGVAPRNFHGLSGTPIYAVWTAMKQRCYNPQEPAYKDYGARGITVCERWRSSVEKFAADMGERPAGGTLERVDVDGPYTPENCKWASTHEQQRNRRNNTRVILHGKQMVLTDACIALGAAGTHAYWYINKGMTAQEAVDQLIQRKERRDAKNSSRPAKN